jgi:hypothetical protein
VHQKFSLRRVRIPVIVCSALLILVGESFLVSAQTATSKLAKAPATAHVESQRPKPVVGFLHGSEPNFLLVLPPNPVLGDVAAGEIVATAVVGRLHTASSLLGMVHYLF